MKHSFNFSRIRQTFSAQIYNQIVTIGVQFLQVPILLATWGADRYGGWLVLYAIPSYLTLSDFGFTIIAKNNMVMYSASGDKGGALRVYHSVFALLLVIAAVVGVLLGVIVDRTTISALVALGPIPESSAKLVIMFLVGNVVLNQFFLLFCAGIRASGRPAAEVLWGANGRLLEVLATIGAALAGADVAVVAAAVFVVRALLIVSAWHWLRVVAPEMAIGLSQASRVEVRRMISPSLSYMALALAQALSVQGPIILLGAIGTTTDTVLFSTTRTLVRVGTAAGNLINYSVAPEYSRLRGEGNEAGFARLSRIHLLITLAGIFLYGICMYWLAPAVMTRWTHSSVSIVYPFFGLMLLAVAAETLWNCGITPLSSTNRHTKMSYLFVGLTLACSVLGWYLALQDGVTGIAVALVVLHIAMSLAFLARRLNFRRR